MPLGRWSALLAVVLSLCVLGAAAGDAAAAAPAPHGFDGPPNPHELDLSDLVPEAGRLDGVWYVPAGRGRPQVAVSWHFLDRRTVPGWDDPRRYVLTLWNPERPTPGSAHWTPHALIRASPFPLVGRAVRLADVTGDGHDDLLVTVLCSDCNHASAAVSVYATFGDAVRRIYGSHRTLDVTMGGRPHVSVQGRQIEETAWGARAGLLWFDTPWGNVQAVCCPPYRMQTFLRWTGRGWRTVARHRVRPEADRLVARGFPLP